MFPEKDYPLTDVVLLLMLSIKLQVDEDCEMARDLVMKIFMEANKPKSRRTLELMMFKTLRKCTKGLLLLVEVLVLLVQVNAVSLSTMHFFKFSENSFEVLKLLENKVEVLKILKNKSESMKILEIKNDNSVKWYQEPRRMIPEQGDLNHEIPVNETFHVQTDDELTKKELKQIKADDQAIQTIFLGLSEDIYTAVDSYPTTAMNMTLALMAKAFKLNYSTPTNNNQRISSNPRNRQIAQPGNANQNPNGNGNQIRCYNCRGVGYFARNCTVRPKRRDAAYLQTQLLIAQKEEAGIQFQAEEFDLMAAVADLDEIEEVNANFILMANLQQASTSGTQTDKAPVYDSEGSDEVHDYENCYDNEIFNMFTQEVQGTVEQHPVNVEETRVLYDSLYHSLAIEVDKVNMVNRKSKETNTKLTTELARFKNQEKCFEISQEKYDKRERCYQKGFFSQMAKSSEELYFSNISKTVNVSKPISIPNEEFSDDTTPSVARKFLNEVKSTIVTLQRVVKHRMTLETHNWSSSAHQELYKIVKDENFPIVNQVNARMQNFEIQFLKKAAKFVGDFKSLAKEANESLTKHKALELEIEHLLKAVVSQDIMSVVQNASVVDTSNFQTELERTKERFKNCIIQKENEYAKL
nr:hypothetical protein [Tanacetum cinerariifolium]